MAGAPFNLILVTEWSGPFGNGGSFTLANQRRTVRDGKGRIYQERWLLVPKGSKIQSRMDVIQIAWMRFYPPRSAEFMQSLLSPNRHFA